MMVANLPAECELPGMTCSDSGGTWWILVPLGLLAIVAGYRWQVSRFRRCDLCGAGRFDRCRPDCFCPVCVDSERG